MAGRTTFESARKKFQPKRIKILFVAEAPPPKDAKRFFYFVGVRRGDSLFLEMMKVLYPNEFSSTPEVREKKKTLLMQFRADGFFLIDACKHPLPRHASITEKKRALRASLRSLRAKLRKLCNRKTRIVLISRSVYDVCLPELHEFDVVNHEMIDFPGSGSQSEFRRKLSLLLEKTLGLPRR